MTVAGSTEAGSPRTAHQRALSALAFASAFVACGLAAGALAITLLGGRGEPGVVLELPTPESGKPAARHSGPDVPNLIPGEAVTKLVFAGKSLLADPALTENSVQGPLPRIADDGRKPMAAYAAPAASGKFKIAIMVGGLGLSARGTQAALDGLPAAVTLGFLPYAADAGHWVALARAKGHEVVLQVPMEPFDFPESDPGPHTLRAGQDEEANRQRLAWALTRFTGYAGVSNLLGQRFLSDSDALAPTLTYLARRGLYFYDNGAAPQSVAPTVGTQTAIPFAKGVPLDTIGTALEIDRQLSGLEAQAREKGSAAGTAYLYPVSVARIAAWARGLESRGFVLVPVSAIVTEPKQ